MKKTRRIRDYGILIGRMPPGETNTIADVKGVRVGHVTLKGAEQATGVTAVLPHGGNVFREKVVAASHVFNGFGKTIGTVQINELGTLESPIILTNTLSVGIAADAVIEYILRSNPEIGRTTGTVNPVVAECNDMLLNDIRAGYVRQEHVLEALEKASHAFAEGAVGAGTGMVAFGLKGGIGSASRLIRLPFGTYALGVLVLANFGRLDDFILDGRCVGPLIREWIKAREGADAGARTEPDSGGSEGEKPVSWTARRSPGPDGAEAVKPSVWEKGADGRGEGVRAEISNGPRPENSDPERGSIIIIVATDLPVTHRQLLRIIKRTGIGLARTGSYYGNGSGDIAIGFTTAYKMPHGQRSRLFSFACMADDDLDPAFHAAAEATEEAILNAMITAETTVGRAGKKVFGLADFIDHLV